MRTLLVFLFFSISVLGQESHFREVSRVDEDLNADGIQDTIVVLQDSVSDKMPYRMQVFFGKTKVFESDEVLLPKYPNGKDNPESFPEDFIQIDANGGSFIVFYELLRGSFRYTFEWNKKRKAIEMTGFDKVISDGKGKMYTTHFDLKSGKRIEWIADYTSGKEISRKESKLKIRPLPLLSDIKITSQEPYKTD